MSEYTYSQHKDAVGKLRHLASEINICLFCSAMATSSDDSCRPMATSDIDDEGTIWFMSPRHSEKNKEISEEPHVKLYYSHPGKSIFLLVSGKADIVYDRGKIRELWNPLDRTWFSEGVEDPEISLIRVRPDQAHYWDAKGNRMVNFFNRDLLVREGNRIAGLHGA